MILLILLDVFIEIVTDDVRTVNASQHSDFVQRILLFFLIELVDLDYFHGVDLPCINNLNNLLVTLPSHFLHSTVTPFP